MQGQACRAHLYWSGKQSRPCYSAMHNAQAMMTSAHAMYYNGHIKVIDMTRVKSSKVRTILLRDCHAKLHVIAGAVASIDWEAHAQVASGEWA